MCRTLLDIVSKKVLIPLVLFVTSIWLLIQVEPYGEFYETNKSMDVSGYVEVQNNSPIIQNFMTDKGEKVLLSGIRVILINIPETAQGTLLTAVINDNKEILAQNEIPFADIVPGEYIDLFFDNAVYVEKNKEYCIEFKVKDADTFPYLLVQESTSKNNWNTGLVSAENEETDNTLLISYKYSGIKSWKIKVIEIIVLFLILLSLYSYINNIQIIVRNTDKIVIMICVLSLIPLLLLGKYNRPLADDFDYSVYTHEVVQTQDYNVIDLIKAALKTDMQYYQGWQGLYTSAFILAFQPGIFGEEYYALTTPIMMLIIFFCIYLSHRLLMETCSIQNSRKKSTFFSIVFCTILIQGLPYAREGLYWFNGAMNYMPFAFLTILNIAIVLKNMYAKRNNGLVVISILLSFIISGGNHVTAFANIMLLCVMTYLGILRKKFSSLFSLITASIGFMIVYFAPGTAVRQGMLEKQDVISTVVASTVGCIDLLFRWCNLHYFLSILLLLPFILEIVYFARKQKLKYHPLFFSLVSVIIVIGMLCVPYYAMGFFGFGRLTNVVWILFLLISIINVTYLLIYINEKSGFIDKVYAKNHTSKCLLIMVVVFVCMKGNCTENGISNTNEAVNELFVYDEAQMFAQQLDERYRSIEEFKGTENEVLSVESLSHYPYLLYGGDIGEDEGEWPNTSYKNYYGVKVKISK